MRKNVKNDMQDYLKILNDEQRSAVVHEGSSLLILAGAGSGKTRVITSKIAYLISEKNVDPWSILSVTFTKKAANEMKERAVTIEPRASESQIRTFHSFGSWFLRRYSEAAGLENTFTVYDDDDMATLLKKAVPSLSTKELKLAVHQISLAKDYCLTPEDDLSILNSEFDIDNLYAEYQKRLRATGNADFGDLIMLPYQILDKEEEIANYIHNRFRVIMVDEYQDSNIAQYKLLQKLSGVEGNNPAYVCVVGDDDQSIYHFRGAEVQNILTFPDRFPGTDVIRLERNYRSTSKILNAANLVVKKNQDRMDKNLIADRGSGKNPVLAFVGDANAEVSFVADLIKASVDAKGSGEKGKYSDWAVLYRTNSQSLGFEKEFIHRKIPYVVVGSLKFYEREEIKDALSYLSLCANQRDEISFRRVINKPTRGIGEKTQDKLMEAAMIVREDGSPGFDNLIESAKRSAPQLSKKARDGVEAFVKLFETVLSCFDKSKKLSDFVERVIRDSGLDEYHKAGDEIDGTTRVQNLQELVNSAVPYECTMEGLLAFLDAINLDRTLATQAEEDMDNAVTLITLHNTKGLEYNKVVITGLEEGVFPRQDKTGAELEEERRLFYVGITRARDELYVTSAAKRCLYGSWQYMRPSPFIKEGASAFKVVGQAPFGFGAFHASASFNPRTAGLSAGYAAGYRAENSVVAEKWKKGVKVYHDDYGYGMIVKAYETDSEYVVEVQFEGGNSKKFLPRYQAKSLTIVKD